MTQYSYRRQKKAKQGFTLVEILVSILIITVLATILFTLTKSMRERANNAVSISNIRQMGTVLLAVAGDEQGKLYFFSGGVGQGKYLPARKILDYLEVPDKTNGKSTVLDILYWNAKKMPPKDPHANPFWFCRAVNMARLTYPDGSSDRWVSSKVTNDAGDNATMVALQLGSVNKPHRYPLVIDSSGSEGQESFRVTVPPDSHYLARVGLRSQGRAAAFLVDGSAKLMDKEDLRKSGFREAYDNSVSPPRIVTF